MSSRPELRTLTSLRGIAAWMVVLYHIRWWIGGLPPAGLAVVSKGYLAVDFFFLLSGFVMWLTWADRLHAEGWTAFPLFMRKRIARIWPLHAFMLGVCVVLALALWALGKPDAQYPAALLPEHLLLVQAWGFPGTLKWNDPAWSISAELAAYLLFPAIALTIDWRRVPSWGVIAAIALLIGLLALTLGSAHASLLSYDISHFGLLRCLVEFSCGTGLCALWQRWRHDPIAPALISASLGTTLLFFAVLLGIPETLAAPAGFAALLLAAALVDRPGNPLGHPVLHYLGLISFATYLSHMVIWKVFKLTVLRDGQEMSPPVVALLLVLILAASIALYHGLERPAQRWVNRIKLPALRRTQRV